MAKNKYCPACRALILTGLPAVCPSCKLGIGSPRTPMGKSQPKTFASPGGFRSREVIEHMDIPLDEYVRRMQSSGYL